MSKLSLHILDTRTRQLLPAVHGIPFADSHIELIRSQQPPSATKLEWSSMDLKSRSMSLEQSGVPYSPRKASRSRVAALEEVSPIPASCNIALRAESRGPRRRR